MFLEVTYLTGRVHATPWGHHVNEGLIEWPPSPWRILRALLAAGFTRLGWTDVPPAARRLFERLAAAPPPSYLLPAATASHTRHYMPLRESDKTSKIIDAFAHVDGPLHVAIDVALDDEQLGLLDDLLEVLPYLGRAESWVRIRRVDEPSPGGSWCHPSEGLSRPDVERVRLLAPMTAEAYAPWREEALSADVAREQSSAGAPLSKPRRSALAKAYPDDILACLLQETRVLQSSGRTPGWNQLPGSRWVDYDRPAAALRTPPARFAAPRSARDEATTVLFALSADTERGTTWPPIEDAILRLDALHKLLVSGSDAGDGRGPAPCFTGDVPERDHRHATLIPLSLRRPGRLDHVLLHAPMGLADPRVRAALDGVHRIYARDIPSLFVVIAGVGQAKDFEDLVGVVRTGSTFRSWTPLVPPRHLKLRGRHSLLGQIQEELESRHHPRASLIEVRMGDAWAPVEEGLPVSCRSSLVRGFRRRRANRPPPADIGFDLRLHFSKPVEGPISLGYASHFGLGAFVPES